MAIWGLSERWKISFSLSLPFYVTASQINKINLQKALVYLFKQLTSPQLVSIWPHGAKGLHQYPGSLRLKTGTIVPPMTQVPLPFCITILDRQSLSLDSRKILYCSVRKDRNKRQSTKIFVGFCTFIQNGIPLKQLFPKPFGQKKFT